MGEMDIYMRRRLVALGGLVAFFIFFVLVVRSCGGDDEPEAPLTPVESGATGETGAVALGVEEFIAQADAICGEANSAVGALDPTDADATRREAQITAEESAQLEQLQVEEESPVLRRFKSELRNVVDAVEAKATAVQRDDVAAADEAQIAIDTAEAEARALGERYGFLDCGQFLNAGEAPGGGGGADPGAVDGGAAAPDPTAPPATPPAETPPAETPPAAPPEETPPPPADDGGGGITP